jgi:PAS domain S-box-containing protein
LESYAILDTPFEQAYDDFALLASKICEAPIALISFATESRHWFKARVNCELRECSHEDSICSHAIQGDELSVIPDLLKDERFSSGRFVVGPPHARFYAGAPLISPEGETLGSICVLDVVPRTLTEQQKDALTILSRTVMAKLNLRRKNHTLSALGLSQEQLVASLRESELRARLLSDAFSPIHWSMNASLRDFEATERWLEFSGITEEELASDGWLSTVHPEDRKRLLAEFQPGHEAEAARGAEARVRYCDGSWRWMLVRAVPLKGPKGELLRWLGTNVDIHEQHEAESALRSSEQRLRIAMEAAQLGTWETCLESGVTAWDERGQKQFGSPVSSMDSGEALELMHPDDRARIVAAGQKAMEGEGDVYETEFRVVWPDGSIHWLSCNSRVEFAGEGATRKPVRMAGVNRDITEKRRAQEALQVKTELLTAVSESLEAFLSHGDWNHALSRLLRCAVEQTASRYGFVGVLTEDGSELRVLAYEGLTAETGASEAFIADSQDCFREKGYITFKRFDNRFGEVIRTRAAVVFDAAKDPLPERMPPGHPPLSTYLGVPILRGADVVGMIALANRKGGYSQTEQAAMEMLVQQAGVLCDSYRQNEREVILKQEREALEVQLRHAQKMEAVGQLAGGVAHDFNNLLTVITGHAELSLMQFPLSGPQRDSLLQIAMAGERAAQLTRQLLTFSRRQIFNPGPIEVNDVIREIVQMLSRLVGETVSIDTEFAPHLPGIIGDSGMIEQVLMNLVVNARDAMKGSGTVFIKTGIRLVDAEEAESKPGAKRGINVWISVSDTGEGIPPQHLAHIFEPFYTTKGVGEGTGLGLATVYGIVQQHGGWVEVDSEVGSGTTFTVLIPATGGDIADDEPTEEVEIRGGTETILLVEDEEFVRLFARRVLEEQGYAVIEAVNGAEALEVWEARHEEIDLLLTDMVMPGKLSGRDVSEKILQARPNLPVIYCSGYSQELLKTGLDLGSGISFLPKPYRPQDLAEAIRNSLDHAS